jgi:hypothetical protein
MTRSTAGFALVIALAWCGFAAAQEGADDEAREQFDTGVELFEAGKFEQAAVSFARAYELKPSFKLLYNIGQVENELGHFAKALDAYTRYLAEGGDQVERVRLEQVRAEVKRLNKLVGMIAIEGAPPGAAVYIDERRSGAAPLPGPIFVDLGEHQVRVKQGAVELHSELVTVAGGQQVVVRIEGGGAADAPPVAAVTASGEEDEDDTPSVPATYEKPKRVWTWIAFGVGGAAAIGAAITGGLTMGKADELKSDCEGNVCPAGSAGELDSARALGNVTNALVAVAAVGVAAGVVFYFVEPRWSKNESAVEVAPVAAPTAGGGALALVGRF